MNAPGMAVAWKRVQGRLRRVAETELGEEQVCVSCGELWPLDGEFFVVARERAGYECRACIQERSKGREGTY